jgi:aminoacrylate hydrolase
MMLSRQGALLAAKGGLMPKAAVDGIEIHYETVGDGPPLFLVPGLGGVGNYWMPQIKSFSERFTVIVHDHRGTGQSTRSQILYSVDQMTKDLLGLMDALGINRAHLVGHSTGGAIGQTMAIEHPDRIDGLVLYATWTKCDPYMRRIFETRKTLLRDSGVEAYIKATPIFLYPDWWINQNADAFERADRDLIQGFPSAQIAASRCDAVMNFDRVNQLSEIQARPLVICAADDFLTPAYFSRELAEQIPGAELKILPRGGHCVSQTQPESFNEAVLSFLQGQPRSSYAVSARSSKRGQASY